MSRSVTFPSVYAGSSRLFHSQLDVIFRTGDAPLGVTPEVRLDVSDDGGNTWLLLPPRILEPPTVGASGEYRRVVRWAQLGSARDRVYRITMTDDAPFHLLDAQLNVAQGAR